MEYSGFIYKIGKTEQVTDKFKKRLLVLTDRAEKYAQLIPFDFTQKNCDLLEGLNEGDEVTVTFSLKGREWKGRFFCSLDAFKIEGISKAEPQKTNDYQDLPF
jgi:single-strand DNA-binding protein